MELKIYWTDFSKRELKKIFNYYKEKANLNVAKNLVLGITKETVKLKKQPGIGQEEELLENDINKLYQFLTTKENKKYCPDHIYEHFTNLFIELKELQK